MKFFTPESYAQSVMDSSRPETDNQIKNDIDLVLQHLYQLEAKVSNCESRIHYIKHQILLGREYKKSSQTVCDLESKQKILSDRVKKINTLREMLKEAFDIK